MAAVPTILEAEASIVSTLESLEWATDEPFFHPDSILVTPIPPSELIHLPAVQINVQSGRGDPDLPGLRTCRIQVTIYDTHYADADGQLVWTGDGDDDAAETARSLTQTSRRVQEALLGKGDVPLRFFADSEGARRTKDDTWVAFQDLVFTADCTVNATEPAEIIRQAGRLYIVNPDSGVETSLGEVTSLQTIIEENDTIEDDEGEGGSPNLGLEGGYAVTVECNQRGYLAAALDLFRNPTGGDNGSLVNLSNAQAGKKKTPLILRFRPRDANSDEIGWTLYNAIVDRRRVVIDWSHEKELLMAARFTGMSRSGDILGIYRMNDEPTYPAS